MNRPTFQIVVNCHGEILTLAVMHYAANCVCAIVGTEKTDKAFWMTQDDILHDLRARNQLPIRIDDRKYFEAARFYEDSMDLYLQGEIKPVARIVGFKMPEWCGR